MKLAILDKDGTLVKPISGHTFVQSPTDQQLLPGVEKAIARLVSDGYTLAIASNQGGVQSWHKSLEDAIAEMNYCMNNLLPKIKEAYFCPDLQGDKCVKVWRSNLDKNLYFRIIGRTDLPINYAGFRKPDDGMIWLARYGKRVFSRDCLMIGDQECDYLAATTAKIKFIWADDWRNQP